MKKRDPELVWPMEKFDKIEKAAMLSMNFQSQEKKKITSQNLYNRKLEYNEKKK